MDLPITITIIVTQEDIDEGTPECKADCPIARAAIRQFPGHLVTVFKDRIYIGGNIYWLPEAATEFIRAFDELIRVLPFTFQITQRVW